MKRILLLGLVTLLFIGAFVPQPAAADYVSETRTIPYDDYLFYTLTYKGSGTLDITADPTYSGTYFDVYVLSSTEYYDYKSESTFNYYVYCSDENTDYASTSCSLGAGSYYIVFDNKDFSGAAYSYEAITLSITIETTDSGSSANGGNGDDLYGSVLCWAIGGIILVIIIIVAVVSMKKRRTASGAPVRPTAYQPPPPAHQPGYVGAPPPQQQVYEPPPPPSPQQQYSPPPPPSQQPAPQPQAHDAPPPDLELPGMMGGTRGTLDETYKGKKPQQ